MFRRRARYPKTGDANSNAEFDVAFAVTAASSFRADGKAAAASELVWGRYFDMVQGQPGTSVNKLILRLSNADRSALERHLEPVSLKMGQVLERPGQIVEYAYFPIEGVASVIAIDGAKRRVEAGPFGREGMSGLPILLHADSSPLETIVQMPGSAHRIKAEDLLRLIKDSSEMQRLFLRYVQASAVQTAHTMLAAALGSVELRLARWLLMLHDRVDGEDLRITHSFMALMLSVRRPGVTSAIHILEGEGLIQANRVRLQVRNRAALERKCGAFYGLPEREYERLIGTGGG